MTVSPDASGPVRDVPVWRVGPERRGAHVGPRDVVVREAVVELVLNGRPLVRANCLPADLEDFALGFLAGEGLIEGPQAVLAVAVSADSAPVGDESGAPQRGAAARPQDVPSEPAPAQEHGRQATGGARRPGTLETHRVEARASVDPDRLALFLERLATSSGCGGGASATAATAPVCRSDARFRAEDLCDRMREFERASPLFRETGGVHAAAMTDGRTIEAFAEDIGRHSAVDKAVGRCLRQGIAPAARALLTTGRLSADILAKAARVGLPVVVSAGAVTSRAIELAREADIAAVGFARARRMNVYTAPWRLGLAAPGADT
jgi:FdhD protein